MGLGDGGGADAVSTLVGWADFRAVRSCFASGFGRPFAFFNTGIPSASPSSCFGSEPPCTAGDPPGTFAKSKEAIDPLRLGVACLGCSRGDFEMALLMKGTINIWCIYIYMVYMICRYICNA